MTGRTFSCLGFLQVYSSKRAQLRKFLGIHFLVASFRENIQLGNKRIEQNAILEVKLPQLQAVCTGHGWILTFVKWLHFFIGPWLLVCQFMEISNQMESNGEVSNFEMKNLCNSVLHNFFYPKFDTSPFDSIWLEISIDWHTKSQGPKKKFTHFIIERIHSWLTDTAHN